MTPAGFEPTISTGERTQTYALDRAAIGTDSEYIILKYLIILSLQIFSDLLSLVLTFLPLTQSESN